MTQHLQSLQEQVDGLYTNMAALQQKAELQRTSSVGPLDPQIAYQTQSPDEVRVKQRLAPHFSGPTSSAYDFDVANPSLQSMGIKQPGYGTGEAATGRGGSVPNIGSPSISNIPQQNVNPCKDPLLSLTQDEVLRLCHIYDEEIASSAPMLDMDEIIKKAKTLFTFVDSLRRVGFLQKSVEKGESFSDDETLILKMILATALAVEHGGQSEAGSALFENVRRLTNLQDRLGNPASIKYLQLLTITVRSVTAPMPLRWSSADNLFCRDNTIYILTRKLKPTESLVSQHVHALRWVSIVAKSWPKPSPPKRS